MQCTHAAASEGRANLNTQAGTFVLDVSQRRARTAVNKRNTKPCLRFGFQVGAKISLQEDISSIIWY